MRYAQRGRYKPAEQQRRELLRLQAAERFARGDGINELARDPRVTPGVGAAVAPGLAGRWAEALRSKGGTAKISLKPAVGSSGDTAYWTVRISATSTARTPGLTRPPDPTALAT
jgi:hypothetical protein